SLGTIDENQKISAVVQNARIVLNRMMAEARQADAVQTDASRISVLPPMDFDDEGYPLPGQVSLTEYELVNGTLWYRQTMDGHENSYSILTPDDGVIVDDFAVTCVPPSGVPAIESLTATLALQVGDNQFVVTASTNPRRNVQW
ncbi:MAG: hypothetical protein HQ546_10405, partial [Planctomycetes bacterium]|nr:hypothetical protein [Planctomycetota bacterium]